MPSISLRESSRGRFAAAKAERQELGESDYPIDEEFLSLLPEIGSASGVALGVDRLVALLCSDGREDGWEFGMHLIPREMHSGMILEIPVHTYGYVHPSVATNHYLGATLVEFEEVCVRGFQFELELARSTFVNAFEQIADR